MKSKKISNLPPNEDEYWEEAQTYQFKPRPIEICTTHTRENWKSHKGYIDNHDGTINCKFCPWGTKLAGYYRVHEERIIDLRGVEGDNLIQTH
jgi:hypothetical protein